MIDKSVEGGQTANQGDIFTNQNGPTRNDGDPNDKSMLSYYI